MILLLLAIDQHGRWGPIMQNFLLHLDIDHQYNFCQNRPNAKIMFHRATTNPCPLGVLKTADQMWKQNQKRQFFGYSYTASSPSIYTIQKLGLGLTKAFTCLME
jgi:hypothetical protein